MPLTDDFVTETELAEAVSRARRVNSALLQVKIERMTALLREHGIPLPSEDPRLGASDGEHLARCRAVVTSAYELLEKIDQFDRSLDELRETVGSGVELLRKW